MNKVKLCEHPEYARYFKMLERGFPINNVKRIMLYDGKDPSILDQDPNDLEEVEDDDNDNSSKKDNITISNNSKVNTEDSTEDSIRKKEMDGKDKLMIKERIQELQNKKYDLEDKIRRYQSQLQEVQKVINDLENEYSSVK